MLLEGLPRESENVSVPRLLRHTIQAVAAEQQVHAGLAGIEAAQAAFLGPLTEHGDIGNLGQIEAGFGIRLKLGHAAVADAFALAVLCEVRAAGAIGLDLPNVPVVR